MVAPQLSRVPVDLRDIFGEPDVKRGGRRISSVKMATTSTLTSGLRGEKMTKSMALIVEIMLNARDREACQEETVAIR